MKFMTLVKSSEKSGPAPKELMDAIWKLGEEGTKAGVLVETGGLLPSAMGAKVKLADGNITVSDGPFAEAKEVIGGYAVYNVKSKQEAVEWAKKFLQVHKANWKGWDGEVELRQIFDVTEFAPPRK